jgi:hypothetical protein
VVQVPDEAKAAVSADITRAAREMAKVCRVCNAQTQALLTGSGRLQAALQQRLAAIGMSAGAAAEYASRLHRIRNEVCQSLFLIPVSLHTM